MTAVLITTNSFPQGDAGAVREESIAKCLMLLGYSVVVVGMGAPTN